MAYAEPYRENCAATRVHSHAVNSFNLSPVLFTGGPYQGKVSLCTSTSYSVTGRDRSDGTDRIGKQIRFNKISSMTLRVTARLLKIQNCCLGTFKLLKGGKDISVYV